MKRNPEEPKEEVDYRKVVVRKPWGFEYLLLPGEEFEVRLESATDHPYFHIVETPGCIQAYSELADFAEVFQNGVLLQPGHNLEKWSPLTFSSIANSSVSAPNSKSKWWPLW